MTTLEWVRPADTTPEARAVQLASFRAMTGEQRLAMAIEMTDEACRVTLAGIAHRQPGLGPSELPAELARLLQR
ncbi:MAG TPA: hypothetical protein VM121_11945 [Acidimicrobiales bacterium]|nr:hypothetical protein [Acidimicrobiales bacterium]